MEQLRASSVPASLIACRIGGEQMCISSITPHSVDLAFAPPLSDDATLVFSLYQPKTGKYRTLSVAARRDADGVRYTFDDAACASAIRETLEIWSEYVNMKRFSQSDRFAEKYLGYPKDTDAYFDSIEAQFSAWFAGFSVDPMQLSGMEIALMIEFPSAWENYLSNSLLLFSEKYAKSKQLDAHFFDALNVRRLYIGSEHCFHLFPDDEALRSIARKAKSEGVALSFCTSIVHQSQMEEAKRRLRLIAEICPDSEVIVNDWGILKLLSESDGVISAFGTILNRFRRDARMAWKAGIRENQRLIEQNALNDAAFFELLTDFGVQRFEYACAPHMQLPQGAKSLHFPFYTTNASAFCPLKAYIETGFRGRQREAENCPIYCEDNAFLYPKPLSMLHRARSLLAAERSLPDTVYLKQFDRLVFNF